VSEPDFVVVGAGGHAKVVIATIEAASGRVVRVLDDEPSLRGRRLGSHIIEGPVTAEAIPAGAVVILAIGSNRRRQELSAKLHVRYGSVVHPTAIVDRTVTIGAGCAVFAGAIIQAGAQLGQHVIVNTGASIDHDCRLGNFAHAAPGSRLAGGVTLDEGALMGIGSCAIPNVRIGPWSTVGAGGAVIREIPAHAIAVGVPARVIRSGRTAVGSEP
jgi:sugar O-acyltransferase (sialic acid O-acetyltransferase NeuD family)